jgi:hypothetical protein
MERIIARPCDDPVFAVLRTLHEYQRLSRRQRDSPMSPEEVSRVTRGKGGLGTVALFALLCPRMDPAEQDVIMELGDVLQLLDDHHDVPLDNAAGVTTSATLGESSLTEVSRRIRDLRTRFARYYGGGRGRQMLAMLYLMLIGAFVVRCGGAGRGSRARRQRPETPLSLLLRRAGNIGS